MMGPYEYFGELKRQERDVRLETATKSLASGKARSEYDRIIADLDEEFKAVKLAEFNDGKTNLYPKDSIEFRAYNDERLRIIKENREVKA